MNNSLKSFLVHTGIIFLWSLLTVIPQLNEVLSQYINPDVASLITILLSTAIKKYVDSRKQS